MACGPVLVADDDALLEELLPRLSSDGVRYDLAVPGPLCLDGYKAIILRPSSSIRVQRADLATATGPLVIVTVSKGTNHLPAPLPPNVSVLSVTGAGNAPDVAELAVYLGTSLMRRVPPSTALVRDGQFKNLPAVGARALRGCTWATVGAGAQVSELLRRLVANDVARVIVGTPAITAEKIDACLKRVPPATRFQSGRVIHADNTRVEFESDLREILRDADVVSLHAKLSNQPRGSWPPTARIIHRGTLAMFRHGAMLVNVARGGLVDENDLVEALISEKLAGYGTDVLDETVEESRDASRSPLYPLVLESPTYRNILITPHIGGSTRQGLSEMLNDVYPKLLSYLKPAQEAS